MKRRCAKILAFLMFFATILQSCFVMPVFADGDYEYTLHYMVGGSTSIGDFYYSGIISEEHPVIVPPGVSNDEVIRQLENNTRDHVSVNIGDTLNITKPFRVLGYTFDGWYYNLDTTNARDPYGKAKKFNGIVTADMVDEYGTIDLYAKWSLYNSPDITSNSVDFVLQNDMGQYVNEPIIWTDSQGANGSAEINFDSSVTDYYGYVYGDVSKLKMSFEQYDPGRVETVISSEYGENEYLYANEAYSVMTVNGTANSDITSTPVTLGELGDYRAAHGYYFNTSTSTQDVQYIENDQSVVSGFKIHTNNYISLNYTQNYNQTGGSDLPEENIISITVHMPEYEDEYTGRTIENTKTYKFHIKRLDISLKPAYGNTPYGRIMDTYSDPSRQNTMKNQFRQTHSFNRHQYSESAWNLYGEDGKQVVIGTQLGENEYINYDEDETAIVVTEGEVFNDPGISLYINGTKVDNEEVKRTIHYTTIESLQYPKWHTSDETDKHETDIITVNTKAPVSILKEETYVKPGIYTIDYEYTPSGMTTPVVAHRSMIVLPKQDSSRPYHFDINMDNFINALDTLVYNINFELNKHVIDNVYYYRILDVDEDGKVNDDDKNMVRDGDNLLLGLYPSLSVAEEIDNTPADEYIVSDTEEDGKAHLYMDFLGTDLGAIANMTPSQAAAIDKTKPLKKGDVFYIGYRFTGVENLTAEEKSALLNEITLSTSYDSRYVAPERTGITALKNFLMVYDKQLYDAQGQELFDIIYTRNTYTVDRSTAFEKWNNIGDGGADDATRVNGYDPSLPGDVSAVRTMRLAMYLKKNKEYTLKNNEYLLKIPMRVENIPPSGEEYTMHEGEEITRQVISTQLGADALNMTLGRNSYGYMWDMSDKSINIFVTHNLKTKLQYMGSFTPVFGEEGDPVIINATYKEPLPNNVTVSSGIFEGTLPPGVVYEAGHLKGAPEKAGDFDFYTNGVRYRMHVNKRQITVIAEDKTTVYGEPLPTFTHRFNESELAVGDTITCDAFTAGLKSPQFTCTATADPVNGYSEIGKYNIEPTLEDSDNYTFVFQKGSLEITQRTLNITDITKDMPHYINPQGEANFALGIVLSDNAIYSAGEFVAGAGDVVADDDIQIIYDVEYIGYTNPTQTKGEGECNVKVKNVRIISAYGRGKNYIPSDYKADKLGAVVKADIYDFRLVDQPLCDYTYGDTINLSTGQISLQLKADKSQYQLVDLKTALGIGLRLDLKNGTDLTEITDESYMPTVIRDDGKTLIQITCPIAVTDSAKHKKLDTDKFVVHPMPITVRADDKERYYGDENTTAYLCDPNNAANKGFTYQMVTNADGTMGRIVTELGDTQNGILTQHITYETSSADTEIRAEDIAADGKGSTFVPINMTYSGTDQNYAVTVSPAYSADNTTGSRLRIMQRPITITELTAPTLKATDYIQSDSTRYSPSREITGFAVAGKKDGSDVTETGALGAKVTNLYNDDPVKINYTVQYNDASLNYNSPYNITSTVYGMDTSYEKSRNYYVDAIQQFTGNKEIRRISDVKVIRRPETSYIYGDNFDLALGEPEDGINESEYIRNDASAKASDSWIRITYDTGEVSDITFADLCRDYADNSEYNDNFELKIKIGDNEAVTLNKAFMDGFNKNDADKHFNVKDSNNIKIAFKAKNVIDGNTREPKPNQENYAWEWTLNITRKEINVTADDQSTTYDRVTFPSSYTCTFDESSFAWGENSQLAVNHSYTCMEDNNVVPADLNTYAGTYTIKLSIPDTDNYTFNCSSGTLTVRQKPLIITNIDVPTLSSVDAEKGNLSVTTKSVWTGEDNGGITFADGYAPFDDDTLEINYTYTFLDNPRDGGEVDVELTGISINRVFGDARNYYLQTIPTVIQGLVESAHIDRLEISKIQGKNAEGQAEEKTYVYGDTLDISGMTFTIHYNSGGESVVTDMADLDKLGVKVEYYKKNTDDNTEVLQTEPVEDGVFLTRNYDGMYIKLSLKDNNDNLGYTVDAADSENSLKVAKRPIHINVNNSSYTYGDNPPSNTAVEYGSEAKDGVYTYYLTEGDFPETEEKSKADFLDELLDADDYVPAEIHAYTERGTGSEPDNKTDATDAGDIYIAAKVDTASSENYTFTANGNAVLTINKRTITVSRIEPVSIPILTADIAFQNGNRPPITVSSDPLEVSAGQTNRLTAENMVNGDNVAFLIDVVYDSVDDTGDDTIEVEVSGISMSDDTENYPKSSNYVLNTENLPLTINGGRVITRRITDIVIDTQPVTEYTYGDFLDIENSVVLIKYTSGDEDTDRVPINLLAEHDIKVVFADGEGNELAELGDVETNKLLTVDGFNGVRIKLMPNSASQVEDPDNFERYIKYTETITVSPKTIKLLADDAQMIYGDAIPALNWRYDENDLVNGDSLTSSRFTLDNKDFTAHDSESHRDYLYVDENITAGGSTLPTGEYDIKWQPISDDKKDDKANYTVEYVGAKLTVDRKELKISDILNVPGLTPEIAEENNAEVPITVPAKKPWSSADANFSFEEGFAPLADDAIEISYDAVYHTVHSGETTVDIKNVAIDENSTAYPKNKNYFISDAPDTASATVHKEIIRLVEITSDPVMRDDYNTLPIEYKYTDGLNLSRGAIRITYNNGLVIDNIYFKDIEEVSEGLITLSYCDDEGNDTDLDDPENGQILYVSKHNGMHIRVNISGVENVKFKYLGTETDILKTGAIKVNKAPVTTKVILSESSRIYGDENPSYTFEYSGFINGDDVDSVNFKGEEGEFAEPEIDSAINIKTPVGEGYKVGIEKDTGNSPNYYFDGVEATLDITPRILDVRNIIGGVPALTSKIIREQPGDVHVLRGYALNSVGQLVLENLSKGDVVRISYDAIYTTVEPEMRNITVAIDNVRIENYEQGKNYTLRDVPDTAYGGNIYTRKIGDIDIAKQPKLEYTYGEDIDLAEPGVNINYDDGEVLAGVPYDQLDMYDIVLYITYMDEDGNEITEPAMDLYERQRQHRENGTTPDGVYRLDTVLFNNAYYTLVPNEEMSAVSAYRATTHKMTLHKKQVDVHIDSAVSTYGEDPFPSFSYDYGDGFEYGDTAEEVVYREPEFICVEKNGTKVGKSTQVGQYTISMTRPDARNYNFHINTNKLTIEKRPLIVTNITSGIPSLTADIIAANPGVAHYLPAFATQSQMKSDRINDDNIRISYDAVYSSESPNSRYDVGITNIQLDENYGRNKNYTIDAANSVKTVIGGGKIFAQAVKSVQITEQPKLIYTYGEPLDLNSGNVHITYDTGAEGDIKFSELREVGIELVYYDDASEQETGAVNNGDIITVKGQNGKKIKLKIESAYDIGSVYTDSLTVTKAAADITAVTLDADNLSVSNKTNNITVTPPQMPDAMKKGGAKYEYSIDGGKTWQESNIFTGLSMGTEYGVSIRFAETDNYIQSEPSTAVPVTTYKNRLRIAKTSSAISGEDDVLFTEYTNDESISTEAALKGLVGSASAAYGKFYNDKGGKTATTFPYRLTANSTIYTSIKDSDPVPPNPGNNGGGGGGDGSSGALIIKYLNDDYTAGATVPEKIVITTDTKTVRLTTVTGRQTSNIAWTSDNKEVATVNAGIVTIHKEGVAVITAYAEGNQARSDSVIIKVIEKQGGGDTVEPKLNIPYMCGYDGKIKPDDYMTRAEAATIIVKLAGDTGEKYENTFPDVREGTWYKDIIAQAAARGLLTGYDDGNFYPEAKVTREQFAAMVVKLAKIKPISGQTFSDVEDWRWSAGSINAAVKNGIITGYSDGTFLPENPIRRSEAARMANVAIGRITDKDFLNTIECPYSDLFKTHWAYYEFIIAAVEFELP